MYEALREAIGVIVDGIRQTLENAPPTVAEDIVRSGITLTGGGALIYGIDRLISDATGLKVVVAENALEAVAEGTGTSLSNIDKLERYASIGKKR
jgi:rod shape-determining protein MreB